MRQYDLIADRIEEVVANAFTSIQTAHVGSFQYSILFNPNRYHTWFLVLFSPSIDSLKIALKDGTCYLFNKYLAGSFSKDEILSGADIFTCFETGNRPEDITDCDKLHEKLTNKLNRLRNSNETSEVTSCTDCGHDFNNHQLMTFREDESTTPTDGWIICPVDDCTCFKTWSANYAG